MEVNKKKSKKKSLDKKHLPDRREEEVENNQNVKKPRLFNVKEFRKSLVEDNKAVTALREFLNVVRDPEDHDYLFEYVESGGNCLELLQTLELDSTISPALVFELVAFVILKIAVSFPQYQSAAFEACRYMLNNYITVIDKMLGLSSKTVERKACLKLLTAMVTFSLTLAKDILLRVNFHSANIELLTRNTGEPDSVRDYFIRFLSSFLIDGHFASLSVLLDKKGFISSIIKGLQYDVADTLCVVISAMKSYILENSSVSKTMKMKVFNTVVVKDIVNLYNWKGPAALKALRKNKNVSVVVDGYSKSKVSECVHDFLMVLCTSYRSGVIFKDHLLGLGKKTQNSLVYTVLESLERPWEHSYANELVRHICIVCPDLTKTVWSSLKPSLEPRMTKKWLDAMNFAKTLIAELQPSCIEFCAKELNISQLAQAIQILVAPLPILNVLKLENCDNSVKRNVALLHLQMLRSLNMYLEASKNWFNEEKHEKLKSFLSKYVSKNFVDAKTLLSGWDTTGDCHIEAAVISDEKFLETVFDIFDLYNVFAPQLLESLNTPEVQLTDFLGRVSNSCADKEFSAWLQVKMINIFIDLEPGNFSCNTEAFSSVLPLVLKFYYDSTHPNALSVLNKLLKYSGIFYGCSHEINVWVNGVLNLKRFDEDVALGLVSMLKISSKNVMEFSEELSLLRTESEVDGDIAKIVAELENFELTSEEDSVVVKHKYLGPMILGLVKYLTDTTLTKPMKSYVNLVLVNLFHSQTDMEILLEFTKRYEIIPNTIREYLLNCIKKGEVTTFSTKGRIRFESFIEGLFLEDFEETLKMIEINTYSDLPLNLLQTCTFYLTNLLRKSQPSETVFENTLKFIKHLLQYELFHESYIETILAHPVLLQHFSVLNSEDDACTKFLIDNLKLLLEHGFDISPYIKIYREKLFHAIRKVLKKAKKYNQPHFVEYLQLFQLSYSQCGLVLKSIAQLQESDKFFEAFLDIFCYTLKRFASQYNVEEHTEILQPKITKNLTKHFLALNNRQDINVAPLSEAFHAYFEVFPHHIKHISEELLFSLINLNEYKKENIVLLTFLLERNIQFFDSLKDNLDDLCSKKGVLLPILDVLIHKNIEDDVLSQIFQRFEPSLTKALLKPQKAGQHFHSSYEGLTVLIEKFMLVEKCAGFANKVQKFEVTEVFHAKLLQAVFNKVIEDGVSAKQVNNIFLTFVHLQVQLLKRNVKGGDTSEDMSKASSVAQSFNEILKKLLSKTEDMDLKSIAQNDVIKSYIVYCLKFGISGQTELIKSITNTLKLLSNYMEKDYAKTIMDMLLSHSKFLDVVLDEHTPLKLEILRLFLTLCETWKELMERHHIPMLLAAYRATINKCDGVILRLLKLFEENVNQTLFYDFKPYLWGKAAANHYSVGQGSDKSLLRQPKMRDVLNLLEEPDVLYTIRNYPLKENSQLDEDRSMGIDAKSCYDIKFLLAVFSLLLAPEQHVQTYAFTRSGALSLSVAALSSDEKRIRQAACHVLSRFHYHVDANQRGKDNELWIRYVKVVTKGVAASSEKKLNNFSAIYLAEMALILTQPTHVMYLPLSKHLAAKSSLDFNTVPELYTFLHSSDVIYKEQRYFILELLRDGLRSEKDFTVFLRSMAFKLFSELYNCSLANPETKLLILDVILAACKIPLGAKMLCENHSLLPQLFNMVRDVLGLPAKDKQEMQLCVSKAVCILLEIVRTLQDVHSSFLGFYTVMDVVKDDVFELLNDNDRRTVFHVLYLVSERCLNLFTEEVVSVLLRKSGDKLCKYISKYGCEFIDIDHSNSDDVHYYLRLLVKNRVKI